MVDKRFSELLEFTGAIDPELDIVAVSEGSSGSPQTFSSKGAKAKKVVGAVNLQTGVSYQVTADDAYGVISMDSANANSVTIPDDMTEALPVGFTCAIVMRGAGVTTIAAGGLTSPETVQLNDVLGGSVALAGQYSTAVIYKEAADSWIVSGGSGDVT